MSILVKVRKYISNRYILFLFIIGGIILIRIYIFQIYEIPSLSMTPTLETGDYILVNRMSYGPRVMDWWKLLFQKKIEYHWYKGWGEIKRGDVMVFNFPYYQSLSEKYPDMYADAIVKRCFGMPGDTVIIRAESIKPHGSGYFEGTEAKPDLFPHDSTLNWTVDNYGPLWVPCKGKTMQLNSVKAKHYKDVLLYEAYMFGTRKDSLFLNGDSTTNYTLKYNYYFMKGDNFYESQDSRYWGFVPQKNVIGKAVLVLYSLDPDEPWYKCFRWGRFLKKIK